ncbi:MAG: hypothetical protein GY842_22345 [bacterium]|nr:hypothetical protein [bacterium]
MKTTIRRERHSVGASLAAAAFMFPFLYVLVWLILSPPWSLVAVVLACIPTRMVYTSLRWEVLENDGRYCVTCGYDLTANESGTCPECGEAIERDHGTIE